MNKDFNIIVSQNENGQFIATVENLCCSMGVNSEDAVAKVRTAMQRYILWIETPYLSDESPIIIGGCGRSGTTLLRAMLDSHNNITCGPETELFLNYHLKIIHPNQNQIMFNQDLPNRLMSSYGCSPAKLSSLLLSSSCYLEFVENFFKGYTNRFGKNRWAEKTPKNVVCLDYIFQHFPKAKFIHMIRDGRDVYCSLRTHPKHKWENGQLVPTNVLQPRDYCALRWQEDITSGIEWRGHENYMEVRYEDLIQEPEKILRQIMDFVGEDWDENMLEYYKHDSMNRSEQFNASSLGLKKPIYTNAKSRWQNDMDEEDKTVFKQIAGELLIQLGYAESMDW